MELDREDILRSLSTEKNTYFVTDKELDQKIKHILISFDKDRFDLDKKDFPSTRLIQLFLKKGFPVIRSLFQNSFLIHREDLLDQQLDDSVNGFMGQVAKTLIANKPVLLQPLIQELDIYSSSHYSVTEKLIRKFLKTFDQLPGVYATIIKNPKLDFNLKYLSLDEFLILNHRRIKNCKGNQQYIREANFTWEATLELIRHEAGQARKNRNVGELRVRQIVELFKKVGDRSFDIIIYAILNGDISNDFDYFLLTIYKESFYKWLSAKREFSSKDIPLLKYIIFTLEKNILNNYAKNEKILVDFVINRANLEFRVEAIKILNQPEFNDRINEILKILNIKREDERLRGWFIQIDNVISKESITQQLINLLKNKNFKKVQSLLYKNYKGGKTLAITFLKCKDKNLQINALSCLKFFKRKDFFKGFANTILRNPYKFSKLEKNVQIMLLNNKYVLKNSILNDWVNITTKTNLEQEVFEKIISHINLTTIQKNNQNTNEST